jgi:putative sterol carrier protein
VPKYSFLSDKWIREAKKIRDEFAPSAAAAPPMTMNLIVTEVPEGSTNAQDGVMHAHLDSTNGQLDLEEGHLDQAEVTVSADYATVKSLLVDQDPAAAMSAFLSGKIRVQGDLGKLLALQAISPDPEARATAELVAERVKAITLD